MGRKTPDFINLGNGEESRNILLKKLGTNITERFNVLDIEGEGSSCICYNAILLSENRVGRLKEFYPLGLVDGFTRHADNMLEYTASNFSEAEREKELFLKSHNKLKEIFMDEKEGSDISSFIPDFTVYESCDMNGNAPEHPTLYIWTENRKITLFSDFIKQLHRDYDNLPEHKLFTLLSTMITLTNRIGVLHEKGFLHLDIKPNNFGIPTFKENVLTDNIYLFDINTLHSVYEDMVIEDLGTIGYSAPEVRMQCNELINRRSDVYSIGCLLFAAITGEIEGYCDKAYDNIERLIKESELITATDSTNNIRLVELLCQLLKGLLIKQNDRRNYSCEDIVAALEQMRRLLLATEYNERINLKAVSEKLDKKPVKAEVLFLNHLYKHPLYEFSDNEAKEITVLVAGFGNHGQRFLDCCLQIGQMHNKKLNVTVATQNSESEKTLYLKNRPALQEFFSVDGSFKEDEKEYASYGNVYFKEVEFSTDSEKNIDIVLELAKVAPDYIFVSLGNDKVNYNVAKSFNEVALDAKPEGYSVNYVLEKSIKNPENVGNEIILSKPIPRKELTELNRMALNAHLVWVQDSNYDFKAIKKEFKKPYNYTSCIANVVSTKYKLKSIGVDCDDLNKAADVFNEWVLLNEDKTYFNELVAIEHRRWVAEKICKGWTKQTNLQACYNGFINDEKAKKHVCLVRSKQGREKDIELNKEFFDNASTSQIKKLDELDRLSVELHRSLKKIADKTRKNDANLEKYKTQLRNLVLGKSLVEYAYFDWCHCLVSLWNKEKSAVTKYKGLKERLEKALESEDANGKFLMRKADREKALEIISNIHLIYYPIIESLRYDDYKKKDEDLVKYIPFILTYKHNLDIVIPLKFSDNYNRYTKEVPVKDVFANVAAITIINPAKACYVCCIDEKTDIDQAGALFKKINDYLVESDYKAKLSVVIEWNNKKRNNIISFSDIDVLKKELLQLNTIKAVEVVEMDATEKIREAICKLSKVSAIQKLNGLINLSEVFIDDIDKTPCFSLDSAFEIHANGTCNYLNYMKNNKVLTVSNLFKISNARGKNTEFPEFFDEYKEIFDIYLKNRGFWKVLCAVLDNESNEIIEFGDKKTEKDCSNKTFYAPVFTFDALKKVEQYLKKHSIIDNNSHVYLQHTDRCVVELNGVTDKCIRGFEKLLSNIYCLCDEACVCCYTKSTEVFIERKDLMLNNVSAECFVGGTFVFKKNYIKEMLGLLEEQNLIANVTWVNDEFSFCFTSHKSQQLLTKSGAVLEMYIYIACLQSGLFADVATSYEINRGGNEKDNNEFDIVLTSGFKSAFVECKTTNVLENNYYDKLYDLTSEFGINSKAILVADKYQKDVSVQKYPDEILDYGKRKQILTVYDDAALNDIAKTLYDILNE